MYLENMICKWKKKCFSQAQTAERLTKWRICTLLLATSARVWVHMTFKLSEELNAQHGWVFGWCCEMVRRQPSPPPNPQGPWRPGVRNARVWHLMQAVTLNVGGESSQPIQRSSCCFWVRCAWLSLCKRTQKKDSVTSIWEWMMQTD